MATLRIDSVARTRRRRTWRTVLALLIPSAPGIVVACPDCAPDELVPLQLAANARGALLGLVALTFLLVVAVAVAGACLKYTKRLLFAGAMLFGGGIGAYVEGAVVQRVTALSDVAGEGSAGVGSLSTVAEWFSRGNFGLYCWAAALLGCVVLLTETPNVMVFMRNKLVPGGILAGWGMFNILAGVWELYVFNSSAGEGSRLHAWALGFLSAGLVLTSIAATLVVQALKHKPLVATRPVRSVTHAHSRL